jgi:Xaa-Pro aminopeptidase
MPKGEDRRDQRRGQALEALRSEGGLLKDLSFDTISAVGPNGALPHYGGRAPTAARAGHALSVDSGGQYQDGTTDITRTVPLGEPTDEMRDRFTRVLQGHIAIATALFPKGTRGSQLDSFARRPLWEAGLDYAHGTGHGVGASCRSTKGRSAFRRSGRASRAATSRCRRG